MLLDQFHQILKALFPEEDFSLSVHDIFLQVVGSCLADAKIFHGVRHFKPEFFSQTKEVINGISAGNNQSSVFCEINALLAKLLALDSLHVNKRAEIDGEFLSLC